LGRFPFQGIGGKQGGELVQCDRLFGGVNGLQLGFRLIQRSTSSMVTEAAGARPAPRAMEEMVQQREKRGRPLTADALCSFGLA
jgi:hypothetical protein